MPPPTKPDFTDFREEDRGHETPCWVPNRIPNGVGYCEIPTGIVGQRQLAHRAYYERFIGPIPVGLEIDHLCRNRACCNPDHLEAVSRRENIMRGAGPALLSAHNRSGKSGRAASIKRAA